MMGSPESLQVRKAFQSISAAWLRAAIAKQLCVSDYGEVLNDLKIAAEAILNVLSESVGVVTVGLEDSVKNQEHL